MSDDSLRTAYPALATRSDVVMPGAVVPLEVGRARSVQAVDAAMKDGGELVLIAQRDPDVDDPGPGELVHIGVRAEIAQINKHGSRRYTVVVRAQERVLIDSMWQTEPYLVVNVAPFETHLDDEDHDAAGLLASVREALADILTEESDRGDEMRETLSELDEPDDLVDLAIAHLDLDRQAQLDLLCEADVAARLRVIEPHILRLAEVLKMRSDIRGELMGESSRSHREQVLRARMRSIKEELGEVDDDAELDELEERIAATKLSQEARDAARKQIRRMRDMAPASAEYNVARTYVDWLLDLPWQRRSEDTLDVPAARAILDAEHSGLDKVKKRILEFIAVRKLAPEKQGPILCLVGPPGVGKTSLGRSIAHSLGREYVRASLGGVRDDAEIRGHRRTYVGALPGRIVSGLKKAGTINPVFVLDEIDKLSADVRGDPASALLEVLDPEQNAEFVDHYIEVPIDLSKIMFLATANRLDTIPGPLLDRMEVIHVPGYTSAEKRLIARDHLVPRQLAEHGLRAEQLTIDESAVDELIERYTRESGVRNLEREIGTLCRSAAVDVATGDDGSAQVIDRARVADILGPPKFTPEMADASPQIGVATGLAWTPVGGDLLFIEVRGMPGKGKLVLTGQLGDVMSESVQAALSWVRANAATLGIDTHKFEEVDLHLHLPSGAIRKDGPSAGVAIAAALTSLLSDRPLRHDVAVTGEITLRGRVLEVGGIKNKLLAAHRAGIRTVLLPRRNKKDLEEIPQSVRSEIDVRFIEKAEEAFEVLFADGTPDVQAGSSGPPQGASARDDREHPVTS